MKLLSLMMALALGLLPAQTKNPAPVAAPGGERRLEVAAAPTNDGASLAISPDGQKLAFVGLSEGRMHLWVKSLDSNEARPLSGTENAAFPFWSPDSGSIGFFADSKLKRIDIATGAIQQIMDRVSFPAGGSWNRDGTILFGTYGFNMLTRIDAAGGPRTAIRARAPQQLTLVHPQFLPDGRHFLYYVMGTPAGRGIYVGQLDSNEGVRLLDSEAAGVFASGRLLFVSNGKLMAQPFDPVELKLSGAPARLADDVRLAGRAVAALSSGGGHVVYRTGRVGNDRQLTWYDRSGKNLETVGEPFMTSAAQVSLSPDGNTALLNRLVNGVADIFTVDLRSGVFTPFTSDPATDTSPAWSHDGSRIFFSSSRSNTGIELYEKPFGIPAAETLVLSRPGTNHPMDWSRNGKYLLLWKGNPITDLRALRSDDKTEVSIIPPQAAIAAQWPQFSPDGRWIAFQSSSLQPNAGPNEIHIHGPFEPPSVGHTSAKLSPAGGSWVRWTRDGKELFYVAPDGTLMTIPMEFDSNGFKAGTPTPLFRAPMNADTNNYPQQYAVSTDGQRFLVLAAPAIDSPINVILNWKPE